MRFSSLLCLIYTIAPILGLPHKESLKEREVAAVDYDTRLVQTKIMKITNTELLLTCTDTLVLF